MQRGKGTGRRKERNCSKNIVNANYSKFSSEGEGEAGGASRLAGAGLGKDFRQVRAPRAAADATDSKARSAGRRRRRPRPERVPLQSDGKGRDTAERSGPLRARPELRFLLAALRWQMADEKGSF